MDSFILEDVNELLKLKKGESSRLIRIKEACESNEIISLSDRKYIDRLSSQYLRRPEQRKPKSQEKAKFVPFEEQDFTSKKITDSAVNQTPQIEKPEIIREQLFSKKPEERFTENGPNFLQNKKIILSIGSITLALILIGVVAIGFEGIQFPNNLGSIESDSLSDFTMKTDKSSYGTSDIISISGKLSSSSTGVTKLFIENAESEIIWREDLNLKNNGEFSTLLIAGGAGWEKSGKYFLSVEHSEFSNTISFDFVAR